MRVQAFNSSEPPPEYNQEAEDELNTADLHNNPGSYRDIMQFRVSSSRENGLITTSFSKFLILRKVLTKLHPEPLKKGKIAHLTLS